MVSKEAKARLQINEHLKEAGWKLLDDKARRANVAVEGTVDLSTIGDDYETTSKGFIDYLLLDTKGFPLAVLEAKSHDKDPLDGKYQAEKYAIAKRCKYVIMSNGETHYLWDLNQSSEQLIIKFPSQQDLKRMSNITKAKPLTSLEVKPDWIVQSQGGISENDKKYLRDYQLEAVNTIATRFDEGKRRFLMEMATGTGKTLLAGAVIKLFLKSGNAHRAIFLVDRIELAQQAKQSLSFYLREYNICIFKENKEEALQNHIVIATIQSLSYNNNYMKYFSQFDFDLLISDEAHRSIYGQNRAILEFFHGSKIGLTATPKDYLKGIDEKLLNEKDPRKLEKRIMHDTYITFGCEKGEPTFRYDLKAAVEHNPPYLVNPVIFDKRTDKTTKMLTDEGWCDTFVDSVTNEAVEETFKIRQLERKVFSNSLNRLIVNEFLKVAKRDPITKEIGKTLIFCISQKHASKITHLLNEAADKLWQGKYNAHDGVFARQVTSNIAGSQDLTKKFRNNQLGNTRIGVTVNMMTTGYDCEDLLNVVLMRPIFSVSDFIQIKGRGTRLWTFKNEVTGQVVKKDNFYLIDFFAVCEYFEETYDYTDPLPQPSDEKKESPKTKAETTTDAPISVIQGGCIYVGSDFIVKDNVLIIGKECMKIDREAYRNHFEESVLGLMKEEPEFNQAVHADDIDTAERIASEKLMDKPIYYFNLDTLRKAYDALNPLFDFIKKGAGLITKLPDKYDKMQSAFEQFKVLNSDLPYDKLINYNNIFSCYLTSPEYRFAIDNGNYSVLNNQLYGANVPLSSINKQEIDKIISFIRSERIQNVN